MKLRHLGGLCGIRPCSKPGGLACNVSKGSELAYRGPYTEASLVVCRRWILKNLNVQCSLAPRGCMSGEAYSDKNTLWYPFLSWLRVVISRLRRGPTRRRPRVRLMSISARHLQGCLLGPNGTESRSFQEVGSKEYLYGQVNNSEHRDSSPRPLPRTTEVGGYACARNSRLSRRRK